MTSSPLTGFALVPLELVFFPDEIADALEAVDLIYHWAGDYGVAADGVHDAVQQVE